MSQKAESSPNVGRKMKRSSHSFSPQKRKASALQDESKINGHEEKKTKSKIITDDSEILPFKWECPAKPRVSSEIDSANNVYREIDNPGIPGLDVEYTITPGDVWENTPTYRNVKMLEQKFKSGQIIYINRVTPAAEPPPDTAPASEILQFDKRNLWVAKIAQTRARSSKEVYLRVFWLYWPEELPMGRQSYHGDRELIMSNAMDLIDAQSISCSAEVSHWNEFDDEDDEDQNENNRQQERFWRQTLDVNLLGPKKQKGLSSLRKHCKCEKEYNPDKTMYKCSKLNCGIWNHEECLLEDLLSKMYQSKMEGSFDKSLSRIRSYSTSPPITTTINTVTNKTTTIIDNNTITIGDKKEEDEEKSKINDEGDVEVEIDVDKKNDDDDIKENSNSKEKQQQQFYQPKEARKWKRYFSAMILPTNTNTNANTYSSSSTSTTTIKDDTVLALLRQKGKISKDWIVKLECLRCGTFF